jgi:hypothetical protein
MIYSLSIHDDSEARMGSSLQEEILRLLSTVPEGLSAPELRRRLKRKLSQPTLWRCLSALRSRGLLVVEGCARATRYRVAAPGSASVLRNRRALADVHAASRHRERSFLGVREEAMHPVQVEGFRRMTPAEKLRMVADLYRAGIQLKVAGLRMTHPEWTEARLLHEARSSLLHAGT